MALLSKKESKEEKNARKAAEIMAKYRLEEVDPKYADAIRSINDELAGNGFAEVGILLNGKIEDTTKIACLNALVQQNWIIIRQLDEISKKLDK